MQDYHIKEQIQWKPNAPWGGGRQFEKVVKLVKQSLFKATGRANLTKQELEEILPDIEIVLNNRTSCKCQFSHQILCHMGNL